MKQPTLVIMAAGLGSRFGGLKQVTPVGPNDELIIDYSIYDAIKAGFNKIVFIIKPELYDLFHEKVSKKAERFVKIEYVYQGMEVPDGIIIPAERTKPWGTAHAVLACKNAIDSNFAAINADDFYGREAFNSLYDGLMLADETKEKYNFCMAGYILENTLTENGYVSRGVCTADESGNLIDIVERTRIERLKDGVMYTEDGINYNPVDEKSIVSMNAWGFTPSFITEIEKAFPLFLEKNKDNILKAEFYLPTIVNDLIKANKAEVKVIPCHARWYGVTHKEDLEPVKAAIAKMIADGKYPLHLFDEKNFK